VVHVRRFLVVARLWLSDNVAAYPIQERTRPMSRYALVLAVLLAPITTSTFAADAKRPNILFIYADDQSYKTIGCYGAGPEWAKTPNIDKLAAGGVRFERSYLGAWCMPSRASLLTGRLQHAVMSMTMEGTYPGSKYDPAQCPFVPA
jgi:hypothetical protein